MERHAVRLCDRAGRRAGWGGRSASRPRHRASAGVGWRVRGVAGRRGVSAGQRGRRPLQCRDGAGGADHPCRAGRQGAAADRQGDRRTRRHCWGPGRLRCCGVVLAPSSGWPGCIPGRRCWSTIRRSAGLLRPVLGERLQPGVAAFDTGFPDAVEAEIEALGAPVVELAGGGRMCITPTPALTAIDVDLGAATAERRGKAPAQQAANRALLPAVARQIRLRNLGGRDPGRSRRHGGEAAGGVGAGLCRRRWRAIRCGRGFLGSRRLAWPRSCGRGCIRRCMNCWPGRMRPAWPRCGAPRPRWRPPARQPVGLRASAAVADALHADPAALAAFARCAGRKLHARVDHALPRLGWVLEARSDG